MNYLSHFYIYQKASDPYYNLGLILPDLARGKVKSFLKPGRFENDFSRALHLGCLSHYEADKIFHASPFFESYTQKFKVLLNEAPFSPELKRRWFIAHILFEMMLDRLIVNFQPASCTNFYNGLDQVDPEELKNYLLLFDCKDVDVLLHNFEHFRRARYIFKYADNNTFIFSLSRVLLRAGTGEPNEHDRGILKDCISEIEKTIFQNAQLILTELKGIFYT